MNPHQAVFSQLVAAFRQGTLSIDSHRLKGTVEPPGPGDILALPPAGTPAWQAFQDRGSAAMHQGQVGAVILAGGMGTRFQYDEPKALYPIWQGRSFLELKLQDLKRCGIPVYLMTSFHTHDAILAYLQTHDFFGCREQLCLFQQYEMPRLNADGSVRPESATCGHGDFVQALQESGHLAQFLTQGGRYLLFSNIDNLGATCEPAILGLHLSQGKEMTIEVALKVQGDKGGAPAKVDGRLQLVEEFLFPASFDQDSIPVFNTASYVFTAEALQRPFHLPWYLVEKKVEGRSVYQFERLAGDLSRELAIQCLQVDRAARFWPVKKMQDAENVQRLLAQKFARG